MTNSTTPTPAASVPEFTYLVTSMIDGEKVKTFSVTSTDHQDLFILFETAKAATHEHGADAIFTGMGDNLVKLNTYTPSSSQWHTDNLTEAFKGITHFGAVIWDGTEWALFPSNNSNMTREQAIEFIK